MSTKEGGDWRSWVLGGDAAFIRLAFDFERD
jgi:hypothetical protein